MNLHTFIFIGRSGAGKGTQVDLLKKYLSENDPAHPIFQLEMGDDFRSFVKLDNYTASLAKKISDVGGLQPEFLCIYIWGTAFMNRLKGGEHMIIDGSPRKYFEARVMHTALQFYGREKPTVVFIDIDHETAIKRLLARGRGDDFKDAIELRMQWFEKEVKPCVDFYRTSSDIHFLHIDGKKTPEQVHADIIQAVFGK
jgi:adenylate kinase family enzyme